MSKSDFNLWKFTGSLPGILVMRQAPHPIPASGFNTAFDPYATTDDYRFVMDLVTYTTPNRVHGLLHYEGSAQLFFFGYKCGNCRRVFLVPDIASDEYTLAESLRHGCMEASDAQRP